MHTRSKFSLFITAVFLVLSTNVISANAQDTTTQEKAKQVWQVLDYLAVDYGAAVQNGVIVSKDEYGEMQEFSANAEKQLSELPKTDLSAKLVAQAGKLRNMIAAKASPNEVGNQARSLAAEVLKVEGRPGLRFFSPIRC